MIEEADLEKEHLSLAHAVGELAIQFGRLEWDVSELVAAAFGKADMVNRDAINSVISFRQKLDLVAVLAHARISDEEKLKEVLSCVTTLHGFEEERNSLLHAFWSRERTDTYPFRGGFLLNRTRADRKKGIKYIEKPADINAINELSKEIEYFRRIFGQEGSLYFSADILLSAQTK